MLRKINGLQGSVGAFDGGPLPDLPIPFEGVLRSCPTATLVVDAEASERPTVFANPAFYRLTGYAPHEVIGRDRLFLEGEETDSATVARAAQALAARRPVEVEILSYRRDGSSFWNALKLAPVDAGEGEPRHVVATLADVSDRVRTLEQSINQATSMRLEMVRGSRLTPLGVLAATVAHEVTQPLTALNNYLALLRDDPEDGPARRKLLHKAQDQIDRAIGIIGRIRDLMQRGQPKLAPVDLADLLDAATAAVREEHPRLEVERRVELGLPSVEADAVKIEQVVYNLLRNAAQIMEGHRPRVVACLARDGAWARIAIKDDGPGLPPGGEEAIFRPFVSDGKGGSIGVGLALCRSVVEAHGGRVWARNRPEGGAEIAFDLPIRRNAA